MSDLKRLLDEANGAEGALSPDDQVKRKLLQSALGDRPPAGAEARLRGVMGLPPAGASPVAAPPTSLFTMVKWVGLAVLLVVGAAGLRGRVTEAPSAAPRAPEAPAAVQTVEPPAPELAPSRTTAPGSPEALVAATSATTAPPVAVIAPPPSAASGGRPLSLRAELELLDAIRADLGSGSSTSALQKLERYDRDFSKGALTDEAAVLRVEALLAHGEKARAEAFAARFLSSHRGTPYESRIRTLLGEAPETKSTD